MQITDMLMTTAKNNTLKVQEAITANIMPIGEPIKAYTGVSSAGKSCKCSDYKGNNMH